MSVREALDEFITNNQKVKDSLSKLRDAVKQQGSYKIQRYMLNDQFEEANKIMKMLEEFIKVDLETNSDSISEYVHNLFVNSQEEELDADRKDTDKNPGELTFIEREILEEVGYTSVSMLKEMKIEATEKNIYNLSEKGYLEIEKVRWGNEQYLVFHLTEMGKLYFREKYGKDARIKKEVKEEIDIDIIENKLVEIGYEIVTKKGETVEFKMENKSCYGMICTETIENQMNQHYKYKNIAFICKSDEQVDDSLEKVKNWVSRNKEKSKFLAVHFSTISNMKENSLNPFKTIRF